MKFSVAAVLAAAASASASYSGNGTAVVTEVVSAYTTYCPGPTQITHGSKTYTITKPTTLTITDCPCTITRPVVATPVVSCATCGNHQKTMASMSTAAATRGVNGSTTATSVPIAGAGKTAALSGAGLAGLVGFAALVL